MSIPIGSTVVVQGEDRGLWTHGTVVGKGSHNRSYKIQVTKTGRIIMCNRQHIKPTPITAENFLHNQANKHTNRGPLDTILDHIQRHPTPPANRPITNTGITTILFPMNAKREMIYKTLRETKRGRRY